MSGRPCLVAALSMIGSWVTTPPQQPITMPTPDAALEARMTAARPQAVAPPAVVESAETLARFTGVYRSVDDPWRLMPLEVRNGALGYPSVNAAG